MSQLPFPGRWCELVVITLTMVEPGGVSVPGSAGEDEPDMYIDTDARDRPHVPGTSLAGVLKAHLRRDLGRTRAEAWLGRLRPSRPNSPRRVSAPAATPDADSTAATPAETTVDSDPSRLWVLGAVAEGAVEPVLMASTAIDRRRGAARHRTSRLEEVLPAGTRFTAYLRLDDPRDTEVEELMSSLATWRPRLGRRTSAGRGACRIDSLRHGTLDLTTSEGVLAWTTTSGPALYRSIATSSVTVTAAQPDELTLRWRLEGPLFVGGDVGRPQARGTADGAAAKDNVNRPCRSQGHLVVPGTSLKGVIRSRIEYILRSVASETQACLDQTCGRCLTCGWFGHGGGDDDRQQSVGQRSRVRFAPARIEAPSGGSTGGGGRSGRVDTRVRMHVAINRFTGGAAMTMPQDAKVHVSGDKSGALYGVEAPETGQFTLRLDVGELPKTELPLFRALVRLAAQDLHDGIVGIGGGVTRGYGTVQCLNLDDGGLPTCDEARRVVTAYVDLLAPAERTS